MTVNMDSVDFSFIPMLTSVYVMLPSNRYGVKIENNQN